MYQRLLATLLHYANSSAPAVGTERFYALKSFLLRRYARFGGHDMQEIRKECWGYWNSYGDDPVGCQGASCRKCRGTGIYDIRWHRLERWEWCGYLFHVPSGSTSVPCSPDQVTIRGRIEHRDYGKAPGESLLWLLMLTGQWSHLWFDLSTHAYCSWSWYPLLNVQRVAFWLRMKLSWQRCYCGSWFPTWGTGWRICKVCRQPKPQEASDIPF